MSKVRSIGGVTSEKALLGREYTCVLIQSMVVRGRDSD